MSTEDLYQDDVEMLDDYEEPVPEQADQQSHDDEHAEQAFGYADSEAEHEEQSGDRHESPMLDSLELDLTLRCGELRLTLAELRRLDAGTILEVSGIAPGHATLCHGEQVVAEGELVDVEGRLGLQITRLVARS
ncbi:FliM/FliN family flagellar motor switch protein [Pseudomonas syringae pv. syringae]|uniref:FliM/FliN family flagellar motor switch protein n=1 Tax=Pseudomonas syringae TaxID=317 RepID=UPI0023FA2919|nr:FliM/FliN family flagellar motor switch protein [Pseudomonas syringae]MDF5890680.1 FliM/FliN family flagellar motor switch protein [Pseudomonas syringae pv. syringae]